MYDPVEAIRKAVNSYLENRATAGPEAIFIEFAAVKAHLDDFPQELDEVIKKLCEMANLEQGPLRNVLHGQIDILRPHFLIERN